MEQSYELNKQDYIIRFHFVVRNLGEDEIVGVNY
jgi:hypothetical protein